MNSLYAQERLSPSEQAGGGRFAANWGKQVTRPFRDGSRDIDKYIARAPAATREKLKQVRAAIRSVASGSSEVISYGMPGFSYPGYSYRGMFAWFALQRNHIGLYLRPPTIQNHKKELASFVTTKSAVHLPIGAEVPTKLIQKLVRASVRTMKTESR